MVVSFKKPNKVLYLARGEISDTFWAFLHDFSIECQPKLACTVTASFQAVAGESLYLATGTVVISVSV